jgi:hypothetical protein
MATDLNKSGSSDGFQPIGAMKIPIIVGITGHRDLRQQDIPALEAEIRKIFRELKQRHPHTPLIVVSALAEGADCLAAKMGLAEGAELTAILPMPQNEYEEDFKKEESLKEFKELLLKATRVITIPKATQNQRYALSSAEKDCQYALASAWIVRHCHLLVALWDGQDTTLAAGTARTVSYALKGIPAHYVKNLNELLTSQLCAVFWIVTPRQNGPVPESALTTRYLIGEEDWESAVQRTSCPINVSQKNEKAPLKDWRKRLLRLDEFNKECSRFEKGLPFDSNGEFAMLSTVPGKLLPDERQLAATYLSADGLALKCQRSIKWIIVLLVAMVLAGYTCLQVFLVLVPHLQYMLPPYPAMLALATIIYFIVKRENIHDRYLEYRTLAEGQRVQLFWSIAGIREEAVEVHLGHYEGAAGWTTDAMRAWGSMHVKPELEEADSQSSQGEDRIRFAISKWVKNQINYFTKAKLREHRAHKLFGRWSLAVYALSAAGALLWVLAYHEIEIRKPLEILLTLAIALGVPLSVSLEAISQKRAHAEHSKSYERIGRIYASALKVAEAYIEKRDIEGARGVLRTLGKAALEENASWLALHRSRPIDVPKG